MSAMCGGLRISLLWKGKGMGGNSQPLLTGCQGPMWSPGLPLTQEINGKWREKEEALLGAPDRNSPEPAF